MVDPEAERRHPPTTTTSLGVIFGRRFRVGFYLFPLVLASAGLAHTMLCVAVVPLLGLVAPAMIHWEPIGQRVETAADESEHQPGPL